MKEDSSQIGRLHSIQVGLPESRGDENASDPMQSPWYSGFVKLPVSSPVFLETTNLKGDAQADLRVHGGPDKAVLAYALQHYSVWRTELELDNIGPGGFGENLTIDGIDEATVCIGDVWQIGDVKLQVSQPRQPCWKLARRCQRSDLPKLVIKTGRSGWYLRVLRTGELRPDSVIERIEHPHPHWTVQRANQVLYAKDRSEFARRELFELPELAVAWKENL